MLDSIYLMTNTLKSDFWRKNVIILSLCTQRCNGRHNVSRKSINHEWFINFIAWRYFTPRRATSYDKLKALMNVVSKWALHESTVEDKLSISLELIL